MVALPQNQKKSIAPSKPCNIKKPCSPRKSGKKKNIRKRKSKNQTLSDKNSESKNIPKNYGKQIIKFIKENEKLVSEMLEKVGNPCCYG